MGSRDFSHKESKKPKKDKKKAPPAIISPVYTPPATVEVVKKGKKEKFEQ
ncbi:MAG: hypothetical protein WC333_04720 [Dehalococcoidia bacterium]|jgi:hypothetical protein